MNNIIQHSVGKLVVPQRGEDGFLNATRLTKAYQTQTGNRKDVRDWLKTERAKLYTELVSEKTRIPVFSLVERKRGRNGGTWIHPKLAVPFATWLSVEFEMLVADWIEEWMLTRQNLRQLQPTSPTSPPVAMPTPEEIEYLKSRPWEKAELEGESVDWEDVASKSGYSRAMELIKNLSKPKRLNL